jgi:protein SCO1
LALSGIFLWGCSVHAAREPAVKPAAEVAQEVGIDQNLGKRVPLETAFFDESGATKPLSRYFVGRPVILVLAYYECPMLCTEVLNGLVRALRPMSFQPGKEFDILTVSFNPRDTPELAREKKDAYVRHYAKPGAREAWHFLTGTEASIRRLTRAVGFRYLPLESGEFAHAGGIMVVTPDGRLSRYFFGVEFSARDLRWALIEASGNKIGLHVDRLMLLCYRYDPLTGKYGMIISNALRVLGLFTLLILGMSIALMLRHERRAHARALP